MHQLTLSPEKFFYSIDGKVFTSIEDLLNGLKNMTEDTFRYHLNNEKNDFYNWFMGVFQASDLASSIKKVKTKTGFLKKLSKFFPNQHHANKKML